MVNYLALVAALALSAVSGFYSVYGLTAIFASAFYPIIFMGGVLEVSKLVTASWLYNNWSIAPKLLKYYLTSAVLVLMFITSMGTFGFLSRAHIEQSLTLNTGNAEQVEIISNKINFERQSIQDTDKQIQQIDAAISKMTERGQAASSLKAAEQQKKNRDALVKKKDEQVRTISSLTEQKIRLESEVKKLEAEVGPLKYIAELIYGSGGTESIERAVRFVIIIIVFIFDPLAVILLIAANVGIRHRKSLLKTTQSGILKIEDSVLENHTIYTEK